MNSKLFVYLSVIFAMIFWSLTFVWYKEALTYLQPITLVTARLIIASIIMLPVCVLSGKYQKPSRKDWKFFFLLALFEPFLYFLGESKGMQYVSPTTGAIVIALIPLFAPVADWLFFKKRLPLKNLIGIFVSIAGVALVVFQRDGSMDAPLIGILWLSLSVFATIFYSVIVYKLSEKFNPTTIISLQNAIGIIYFIPLVFLVEFDSLLTIEWSVAMLMPVIKLSIFGSTLAFLLYTHSMKFLGISRANVFTNLIPVFTAIFAYFLLGDTLNVQKTIGMAIVIGGLLMAQIRRRGKVLS